MERSNLLTDVLTYSVITTARDEVGNLPRLAGCLRAQTHLPTEWLVVDNGSTDGTAELVSSLADETSWIRLLSIGGGPSPVRGAASVKAFTRGLDELTSPPDVIVNVDADVSMEDDYFERLIGAFAEDSRLGMASGSGHEPAAHGWRQRHVTKGHVWGPSRAYRWTCLPDVLPLVERVGWDGIDEHRASLAGWRTEALPDLPFYHHRPQGTRERSRWEHWAILGESAHYMGYRFPYLVARSVYNMRYELSAAGMVWGYTEAAVEKKPRHPDPAVRDAIRDKQRLRELPLRVREAFGRLER